MGEAVTRSTERPATQVAETYRQSMSRPAIVANPGPDIRAVVVSAQQMPRLVPGT